VNTEAVRVREVCHLSEEIVMSRAGWCRVLLAFPWIGLRVVVRQRYRVSITLVDECSVNTS
jgi:hypothetical protein